MKNSKNKYWQSVCNNFRDGDCEAFKIICNEFFVVLFGYISKITSDTNSNCTTCKLEWYNIGLQFINPFKGSIQIAGRLDITKEQDKILEYLSTLVGLDFIKLNKNNYVVK